MTTATPKAGSELRQRATKANTNGSAEKPVATTKSTADADSAAAGPPIGLLDIARALAGVALVSTIASYAVMGGESLTWGLAAKKPWWMDIQQVRIAMKGPLLLTNDQLAAYDGSDPSKPILLALNRTIYDVSSSPQVYGPGGMYSALAAKDASRSYITTCFDPIEDLVPYFGGLAEVYVPLWLSRKPLKEELEKLALGDMFNGKDGEDLIDDLKKKVGRKHIKGLQDQAYERAEERVREQVRTWEGMFAKKNYMAVGRVVGVDEEDPNKWRHLGFCKEARELRVSLGDSFSEAMESVGKGDKLKLNIGKMTGMFGGEKKKSKKKKKGGRDQRFKEEMGLDGEEILTPEEQENLANTRIEDMLKGGKYYGGDAEVGKKVAALLKEGRPEMADEDSVKKAMEILRMRKKKKEEEGDKDEEEDVEEDKPDDAAPEENSDDAAPEEL